MSDKAQYTIEFVINTSPRVLFSRLSTADGLSEWFADDVNVKADEYTFFWEGTETKAKRISYKDQKHIRFQWLDDADTDCFLEFKLESQDLTGDLSLLITDFATPEDLQDATELWTSQISNLKRLLGI
ncbi:MAG: hypothetical protein CVU05_02655 [Bacteroidetes bacterium HGW-Bacteroidetes-21]|jgi:uncharacterized protein YndB with AHSA1/START domain|nr:MAG: hypothetical protein CVU05_02655 [Bacteroidetes bacterium HGW-Bacteroidetes-21]